LECLLQKIIDINYYPPQGCDCPTHILKLITMPNKLKTPQEKHLELLAARQKKYAQESLGMGWFFAIVAGALLLTALIENI
jgi:hypothetical protein